MKSTAAKVKTFPQETSLKSQEKKKQREEKLKGMKRHACNLQRKGGPSTLQEPETNPLETGELASKQVK